MSNTYPDLYQFFGANFHQDFAFDYARPDDVLHDFINSHSSSECTRLADSIDTLLQRVANDAELENILHNDLACCYLPSADSFTVRGWLQHVSEILRQ